VWNDNNITAAGAPSGINLYLIVSGTGVGVNGHEEDEAAEAGPARIG